MELYGQNSNYYAVADVDALIAAKTMEIEKLQTALQKIADVTDQGLIESIAQEALKGGL